MFYKDILQQLLKDETNSINKMYLHEINIKWKNFEKAAELRDQMLILERRELALR